jgi:hypothetical protein
LDSTQSSLFIGSGDFPKINYIQCHFNYYCKNKSPKIEKPVPIGSQHKMETQRIFGDFIPSSMLTDLLKGKRIQEKKNILRARSARSWTGSPDHRPNLPWARGKEARPG